MVRTWCLGCLSSVLTRALLCGLCLVFALFCARAALAADPLREQARSLFGAIAAAEESQINAPVAELGRALFWDRRLSADGNTACASCHLRKDWGADARQRSPDARGKLTARHSQSVFNTQSAPAGLRWLADRSSGAQQALGSITGSMGFATRDELVAALNEHGYSARFAQAFPDASAPLNAVNYAQALQAYQQTLLTPAPFDAWLAGDDDALEAGALRGLKRFVDTGCGSCHSGPLFGGGSVQRFGMVEDYRPYTGSDTADIGLMQKTGLVADRDRFRVQPLRNVALTAPYFHDGSVAALEHAVAVMAKVQLGQSLSPAGIEDIVAFLQALSGEVPAHYAPPEEG